MEAGSAEGSDRHGSQAESTGDIDGRQGVRVSHQWQAPGRSVPLIVDDRDKLELVNLTDDDLDWKFPGEIFGAPGKKAFKTTGKAHTKTPSTDDHTTPAVYEYHVSKARALPNKGGKPGGGKIQNGDDFADPVIIIET